MDYLAILLDERYQGAAEAIRAIDRTPTSTRGASTEEETLENREVFSVRIFVKNYYGRMPSLFTVLSHKLRCKEPRYDHILRFCLILTNCHVKHHSLRHSDGQHFTGFQNHLRAISSQHAHKRKMAHYRAIERRWMRMRNMEAFSLFADISYIRC